MTAGLPGTGIGGLFYLVLVALMPFREAWLTLRGRSSPARWRFVARSVALASGIVIALFGMSWLVRRGFALLVAAGAVGPGSLRTALDVSGVWSRVAALTAFGLLAAVLGAAALAARLARGTRPRAVSGADGVR